MDDGVDGTEETGKKQRGQQTGQSQQQQQQEAQVAEPTDEEIRAASEEERVGFELRLAGARGVKSAKSCTTILDAVYQREVVPGIANSPACFMLAGMNAKIACEHEALQ